MNLNLNEQPDNRPLREWSSKASQRLTGELLELAKETKDIINGCSFVSSSCLIIALGGIKSVSDRERFLRHHIRETLRIFNATMNAKRKGQP